MLLVELLLILFVGYLHALTGIKVLDDEAEVLGFVFLLVDDLLAFVAFKDFVVLGVLGWCLVTAYRIVVILRRGVVVVVGGDWVHKAIEVIIISGDGIMSWLATTSESKTINYGWGGSQWRNCRIWDVESELVLESIRVL